MTKMAWKIVGACVLVALALAGELSFQYRDETVVRAEAALFYHGLFEEAFGSINYATRKKTSFSSYSLTKPRRSGGLRYYVSGSQASGNLILYWNHETDLNRWTIVRAMIDGREVEGSFPIEVTDEMVSVSEREIYQIQWWPQHRRGAILAGVGHSTNTPPQTVITNPVGLFFWLIFFFHFIIGVFLVALPVRVIKKVALIIGIDISSWKSWMHIGGILIIRIIGVCTCLFSVVFLSVRLFG